MTAEAQIVLKKVRALQELQKTKGFISTRTQRALLLADVSLVLQTERGAR